MSTPAASVTSDMVNGNLMEIKGKMLQWGIQTSIALKCPEHARQPIHGAVEGERTSGSPQDRSQGDSSAPSHGLSPEECQQQQPSIPSSGSRGGTGSSEPAICHNNSKCKVSGCEESPKSDSQGASQEGEADPTRADGDPLQRQRGIMEGHTYTFGSAWKALNDLKKAMKEVASAHDTRAM